MNCPDCHHDLTIHNGPSGECRFGYPPVDPTKRKNAEVEQCLCLGKRMREVDRGTILEGPADFTVF